MAPSACPRETELLDYLERRLAAERVGALDAHLDACPECFLLVSQVLRARGRILESREAVPSQTPTELTAPPGAPAPRLLPGNALGRYVILDRLGAGGMGVVYSAFDRELDRKVALKLLKGTGDELQRERLLREARAQAKLSHPHVLPVYDVGESGNHVFFTMECVEGLDLRRWLQAERAAGRPPPWTRLVELMLAAGEGLAAAHRAGLVHRDFKPQNVLVGTDGRVRVADFGLARAALTPPSGGAPEVAGTPGYLAPELLRGADAGAASDQYSFCVALQEVLQGERPGEERELASPASASRRAPPSGPALPAAVRRVLARGMNPEPAARYPGLEPLLGELQRALPRPWAASWGWAVAGVVLLGIALGAGVFLRERAQLCSGGERALAGVWGAPERERVRRAFEATGLPFAPEAWRGASEVLDRYAARWMEERGEACRATRLRGEQPERTFELRMACFDQRLRELKALVGVLTTEAPGVVRNALQASQSLPSLELCSAAQVGSARTLLPQEPALKEKVLAAQETLARARAELSAGRFEASLALGKDAWEQARTLAYRPLVAEAGVVLSDVYLRRKEGTEAEPVLKDAVSAAEVSALDFTAARAWILRFYVAEAYLRDSALAARWAERAEAAVARAGDLPELTAELALIRAQVLRAQGRETEAVPLAEKGYRLYVQQLGETDPRALAAMDRLAECLRGIEEHERALKLAREGLALRERALGPRHPDLAGALKNVSLGLSDLGKLKDAEQVARRQLALEEESMGKEHPSLLPVLSTLGVMLARQGEYREAQEVLGRARALFDRAPKHQAFQKATVLMALAGLFSQQKKYDEALQFSGEAIDALAAAEGNTHPRLRGYRLFRSGILFDAGRNAETLEEARRGIAIEPLPQDSPDLMRLRIMEGSALINLGRWQEAAKLLGATLQTMEKTPGVFGPTVVGRARFAYAYALGNDPASRERAIQLARQARAEYERQKEGPEAAGQIRQIDEWLAKKVGKKPPARTPAD